MDLLELQWLWGPTSKISVKNQYMSRFPPPYSGQVPKLGQYIGTDNPSGTAVVLSADIIYYVPIVISYYTILDLIGIYLAASEAGKNFVLGIYPFERGVLGKILVETDPISTGSTGYLSFSISLALSPGVYAFAFNTNLTSATIRRSSVSRTILPEADGTEIAINTHYRETQTYDGTLPTTPSGLTLSTSDAPRIIARVRE